jgi:adenylate cyclase
MRVVAAARSLRPDIEALRALAVLGVIAFHFGATDRVNYTIVGDTVNVSQRLQDLGKQLAPDATTSIAISGETASRPDENFETIPAGEHRLRGRGEATAVFQVGEVAMSRREHQGARQARTG